MTDTQPTPIVVAATPVKPQLAASIRQAATLIGATATAFGFSALAAKANIVVSLAPQLADLLAIVGPPIIAAAVWLGQLATRKHAQQAAAMAAKLPDHEAIAK